MAPPRVGDMFGPYELQALLGVGGMGEVYRAFDTVKNRLVALKLLRPELAVDPNFQERFRRESRVAAQLHEPHIIPVHDFGEIAGVLFIDMRLVDGMNLKTVLDQQGPLSATRAAGVVAQVAAALDAAHAGGLTHRDVKPENVLLTTGDFAYLVDFGIARSGADSGLTSAGSAIGSCAYMAPERFTDGTVGPPTDVYSLACLLYECLTARPPFPTGDITQLMSAHLLTPPPRPSALRPDINPAFDDIVGWGMAKDPAHRCPSAGALAQAATKAAAAVPAATQPTVINPSAPQPVTPRQRARWPLISAGAGVAVLVVAAVTVAWLTVGGRDTPQTQPVTVTSTHTTVASGALTTTTHRTATARASLPGTDTLGFLQYPGARCDVGQIPVALARTEFSALVICQTPSGGLLYRGVRLSDSAGIELSDAAVVPGGFDVINPNDGTRYQIRHGALTILTADGQMFTEPMDQYASTL